MQPIQTKAEAGDIDKNLEALITDIRGARELDDLLDIMSSILQSHSEIMALIMVRKKLDLLKEPGASELDKAERKLMLDAHLDLVTLMSAITTALRPPRTCDTELWLDSFKGKLITAMIHYANSESSLVEDIFKGR